MNGAIRIAHSIVVNNNEEVRANLSEHRLYSILCVRPSVGPSIGPNGGWRGQRPSPPAWRPRATQ